MKPAGFTQMEAPQVFREMAETANTQAKNSVEKMSTATIEAASFIKSCYSTAIAGAKDYNEQRFSDFAHTNTNAALCFVQKLCAVKSPTEFVDDSRVNMRASGSRCWPSRPSNLRRSPKK